MCLCFSSRESLGVVARYAILRLSPEAETEGGVAFSIPFRCGVFNEGNESVSAGV